MEIIVGCIAFITTFIGVQYFFFNTKTLEEKLKRTAIKLNNKCPVKIDKSTQLDSVETDAKTTFSYYYTLINIIQEEINLEAVRENIEATIINKVKTNRDLKEFKENNITFDYNYYDRNGNFVTQIIVTPEVYNKN